MNYFAFYSFVIIALVCSLQNLPFVNALSTGLLQSPSSVQFSDSDPNSGNIQSSLLDNTTFSSSCKTICVRKEIHDLTVTELKNYLGALRQLASVPSPDPNYPGLSVYEQYFTMHNNMYQHCHGGSYFLPWHRALIADLEIQLQKINPTICLPYWDESREASNPWSSKVFSSQYYGSINKSDSNGCIADGMFSGLQFSGSTPNSKKCIYRQFSPTEKSQQYDWNMYNQLAANSLNVGSANTQAFTNYAQQLELTHGFMHNDIGGAMATDFSNCDPLFYLHHAFVDKTWNDFQIQLAKKGYSQFGGLKTYKNNTSGMAVETDTLNPWSYSIDDVLDTKHICYIYASPGEGRVYASQFTRTSTGVSAVSLDTSSGYVGSPLENPPAASTMPSIPVNFINREFGVVSVVSKNSTSITLSNGTVVPNNNASLALLNNTNGASSIIENVRNTISDAVQNALQNTTVPDISSSINSQLGSSTNTISNGTSSSTVPTPTGGAFGLSSSLSWTLFLAILLVDLFFNCL